METVVSTDNIKLKMFCISECIQVHDYIAQPQLTSLIDGATFDPSFRNGFWRLTIERFMAFRDFHRIYPSRGVLHIESDIVLLDDFPTAIFESSSKIMWCEVGPTIDSAALFYSPSLKESDWFIEELVSKLNLKRIFTDMTVLKKIRDDNLDRVTIFPSLKSPAELGSELVAIDPSALGVWLIGSDPRNLFGFTKRYQWWELAFDYTFPIRFEFIGRWLYLIEPTRRIRILNLHNHAKNTFFFSFAKNLIIRFFVFSASRRKLSVFPVPRYLYRFLKSQKIERIQKRHFDIIWNMIKSLFN